MRRASLLAVLLAAPCGCGLWLNGPIGKDEHGFDVYPPEDEPAHEILVEGEVRDFVSLRAEPGAVIEVWTDDPSYQPAATIDDQGHFRLRIEQCRREATVAEQNVQRLLWFPSRCGRWLNDLRFRARLGERCSLTYRLGDLPANRESLVLWLDACRQPQPPRPASAGADQP